MEAEKPNYNGWSNYPTWAVNLWLSNDEPLYRETRERGRVHLEDMPTSEKSSHIDDLAHARYQFANELKDWVTDELAPDLGATFAADLLGYALGEVDWHEIAAAWLEDLS